MKDVKQLKIEEANKRVALIQEKIILANSAYQKYLKKGLDCTLNDYLELSKMIEAFYDGRFVDKVDGFGMYKSMKFNKNRYCRKAIKQMEELLADFGIYPSKMIEEYNGHGKEIEENIEKWQNAIILRLASAELSIKEKDFVIKELFSCLKEYREKTLEELILIELPIPHEFIRDSLHKLDELKLD